MKKISKFIFVLLPFAVLFSSCVDITRNIVINADGSGTEKMEVNISQQFFSLMQSLSELDSTKKGKSMYDDSEIIEDIVKNFEGNDITSKPNVTSVLNADSSKTLTIDYSFTNLSAITLALDGDKPADSNGDIYLKEQDGVMKFYYELPNDSKVSQDSDSANAELVAKLFEGKNFTINIEFPYDVISSNATSQNGRKLTWTFPMSSMTEAGEPRVFTAELRK